MTQVIATVTELSALRDALRAEQQEALAKGHTCIRLCLGASCIASGALKVKAALEEQLAERQMRQMEETVSVVGTGCLGPCSGGPALMIGDVFYEKLRPQDARDIVVEHLGRGRVVERLTHKRPDGRAVANAAEMDFFKRQKKILLSNCGLIDPQRIEDYIARDGYQALAKALEQNDPEQVIETLRTSGLRGRGGAGFPTWRKWRFTRDAAGAPKYVVCNADEGDPGAFMDRSVLEGDPHSVIEGMIVAGHTVGAATRLHLRPRRVSAGGPTAEDRDRAGPRARPAGHEHPGHRFQLRLGNPHGLRGLRLRRGDRAADLDRGEPGRAAPPPAVSGRAGLVGKAHRAEQRRDVTPTCRRLSATAASGSPRKAPSGARGRRSSPWPGPSRTPAWSRCRWARPWAT